MSTTPTRPAPEILWPPAPLPGVIAPGEAHLWAWTFPRAGEPLEEDLGIFDDNERQRSARFYFAPDRVKYSVCHANMRRILGSYLQLAPESLIYREGPAGKPALASAIANDSLRFNLSHSRSIAVLAVTAGLEVGVDVEDVRPIEAAVAERFFSAAELAGMAGLEGQDWLDAFYRCWTRKEAILKVEGVGMRIPLDSFDVSVRAEEPAALLAARPEAKLTAHWRLHHFSPANGTMGALALGDPNVRITTHLFCR